MVEKKYGYINYQGKEIIPICYDYLGRFNAEVAFFKRGNNRGYININGKVVAAPTNQNLPKRERTILISKFAKEESRKTTKQQLENPSNLKGRRKRQRTKTQINDKY
ncbi:MAG: WG repeat-containing protein [Okeania sp. SIO3I5]|nr:WG repeat-containing protein [Okeania sp. SIO3I5]NEQ37565.1 WG repeat-containing protein [Okeania sp. SIO3I5]